MKHGRTYKKCLSSLPPFQEAAVLEYAMDFQGELTRFSLRLERGNLQQQTALCVQGLTREQAHSLLLYLYENTVPAENWEDVAEELLSRLPVMDMRPLRSQHVSSEEPHSSEEKERSSEYCLEV